MHIAPLPAIFFSTIRRLVRESDLNMLVEGSMAADDLQPNRMTAAKVSASEFVQRQPPSVQIGVVAFSESGLSVQVPTNDQDAILASINRLEPQQGTSLGYGILTALDTIVTDSGETPTSESEPTPAPVPVGSFGPGIIVLLTDGENTAPPDPFEAAFAAAERGVRIYSIGIGSLAGTTLNINGYTVHTQLNETALEQISGLTGGEYYNAESEEDLREIYDNISPELVIKPEKQEQFFSGPGQGFGGSGFGGGSRRSIDEETLKGIAEMTGGEYYSATSAGELHDVFEQLPTYLITKEESSEISVVFSAVGMLLTDLAILLSMVWHPIP